MQQHQMWSGCLVPCLCSHHPSSQLPVQGKTKVLTTNICQGLENMSIQETREPAQDITNMSLDEISEYIGTLRTTIQKIKNSKPVSEVCGEEDDCSMME